ncbi:MAG: zf-HC2 domain-containing protein [Candidatus Brocadiae bacterium]|nr:zf-HC2 domain-containing protein [Candidatus Brocadiia bacterium]
MRSCEDYEPLLPAYVAGVAEPADVAEIGEHIAECESCTGDLQAVVQDLGLLRAWREPSLPEGLAARILEKIVQVQEARRQVVNSEQIAWGAPLERVLGLAAIFGFAVIVLSVLFTGFAVSRFESRRRGCMDNLRQIGASAAVEGELKPKLGLRLGKLRKPIEEDRFICPLAPPLLPDQTSHYRLDLAGPLYLGGDWRENHGWRDAHILMADGSVIRVTPGQPGLWNLLDPYHPGR